MTEQAAPTVNGRVFEPPGRGPWELESTHASRPMTYLAQDAFRFGFVRGFKEGTARYGVLLSHLEPGFTHSFMYNQPVPVGAPPGAMKPPPKVVLQAVTRLHPEIRRRIQTGQRALRDKIWREDLANWDNVDKPDAIARHQAIQSVDVAGLSDAELADHVDRCVEHAIFSAYLHHKYTIPAIFPVGDFLAGAQEWTGATVGELLGPLRGQSGISRGFAADELDAAAKKLVLSPDAQAVLGGPGPAEEILAELAAREDVGSDVAAYLDAVRWRCVGYDVGDKAAGELPECLVEALRTTVAGGSARPDDDAGLAAIRARVPAEHLDDFDDRLAEVRLMNRLRDERGVYSDGWASGLARRALLEAGRRLVEAGRLNDAEHAVDLRADEVRACCLRPPARPRTEVRIATTGGPPGPSSDAPPFLRALPAAAASAGVLPAAAGAAAAGGRRFAGRTCSASRTRRTPRPSCTGSRSTPASTRARPGWSTTPRTSAGSSRATCSSPG